MFSEEVQKAYLDDYEQIVGKEKPRSKRSESKRFRIKKWLYRIMFVFD
jgi:hypothetical protein